MENPHHWKFSFVKLYYGQLSELQEDWIKIPYASLMAKILR